MQHFIIEAFLFGKEIVCSYDMRNFQTDCLEIEPMKISVLTLKSQHLPWNSLRSVSRDFANITIFLGNSWIQ